MATDKSNSSAFSNRENQISAMRKQLLSSSPDDVRKGTDQVRQWLIDNPEDQETHKLIIDAARENTYLTDEFNSMLKGMIDKGFTVAKDTLSQLNDLSIIKYPNIDDRNFKLGDQSLNVQLPPEQILMNQADSAYYAAEFEKAIFLYQQVLQIQPNNQRAQQQLGKAELNRYSGKPRSDIPRDAMIHYRQARSYIAAKDFNAAINLLTVAVEEAHAGGVEFQEANMSLNRLQDLLTATEFKAKADKDVQAEKWESALELYKKALRLDPTDDTNVNMRDGLQGLLKAEALLDPLGIQVSADRNKKLKIIGISLRETEEIKELVNTNRYKIVFAKYNLYEAEFNLHKWGLFTALAPQGRLKETQQTTKSVLGSDDQALKYVGKQLKRFAPIRFVFFATAAAILGFVAFLSLNQGIRNFPPLINPTITQSISFVASGTPTASRTSTSTPTPTITKTPTVTFTASTTPTPTQQSLGSGFVNFGLIHPQVQPNGKWIGELNRFQVVTIFEQAVVSGDRWYYCKWEKDGITQTGWILAEYIILGPTPTPRPTFSP